MRILSSEEIKKVESKCFDLYYNESELMFKAGKACYDFIIKEYNELLKNKKIAVLCGNGKNAGDGFVISKLLYLSGYSADIILCDKKPTIKEPLEYFNQALSSCVKVKFFDEDINDYDFIIDCIFGIGFNGEPRPPFDKIFEKISKLNATIISVDTPSGTNATNGQVCKNAIKADYTVAISTLKYCHILPPANSYCGKTDVAFIGIPDDCYFDCVKLIEYNDVKNSFPKIEYNANKGSNGHLLCLCGSYTMPGAAVISAKSAIRTGAGLVKITTPKSAYPLIASHLVQPIFNPVDEEKGSYSPVALDDILNDVKWANSVLIGCGIGNNENTSYIVQNSLINSKSPIIIDADGINSIISCIDILKDVKVPVVLTPHPGEMARLTSKTVSEVQSDRINIAKNFAKEYGVIVVLKGANTVVTNGKSVFVNLTGNPSLAMAGTGDMLSGMIASFVAQGLAPYDSAKAGVFIHGRCADEAVKKYSIRGLTVFDLIEQLGSLMSDFE